MRHLSAQILAVVGMNLRSLPSRASISLVTLVAVAVVVTVLLSFLAMANGFRSTVAGTGAADVAIVLREGSDVYASDVVRLVREAQEQGLVPDGDPRLYAVGVLGVVSSFSHALRNGSLDADPHELATFVGGWVVRALSGEPLART